MANDRRFGRCLFAHDLQVHRNELFATDQCDQTVVAERAAGTAAERKDLVSRFTVECDQGRVLEDL